MGIQLSELTSFLTFIPNQGVILMDQEYLVQDISESALEIFQRKFSQLFYTDLRETLPQLFDEGHLQMGQIRLSHTQYIDLHVMAIPEEGVQLLLIRDITKQVMHDIYFLVLNFLREAIIISDRDGYVIHVNDAAAEVEGLTDQNAAGRSLRELYELLEDEDYLSAQAIREKRSYPNTRQVYTLENGRMMDCLVSAYPIIMEDKVFGAVCITEDYRNTV